MGRSPCCSKEGLNRGAWTASEDKILTDYIKIHGEGRWRNLPERAGLKRCGKSCRLRWLNYLRPDIKRGNISHDEEELIIRLHRLLGNRWSLIAGRLPGRTDNEIKNYWNTILGKKVNYHRYGSASPSIRRNSNQSQDNMKKNSSIVSSPPNYRTDSQLGTQSHPTWPTSIVNPLDQPSLSKGLPSLFTPEDLDPAALMLDVEMGDVLVSDLLDFNYDNCLLVPFPSGGAPFEDWAVTYNQPNVAPNHHGLGFNFPES